MKTCSKCKIKKRKEKFSKKASSKDGLNGWCKNCNSESIKKWRIKNKAHIDSYTKNYNNKNERLIKQRKKHYREKNKDDIKIYMKKYRTENKAQIKQSKKEYREKNIEKIRAYDRIKNKEYRNNPNNKEIIKAYNIEYRSNPINKKRIAENQKLRQKEFLTKNKDYNKDYYKKNGEIIKLLAIEYYRNNKEKVKMNVRKYAKKNRHKRNKREALRYKTDIKHHLSVKLRNYFRASFKKNLKSGKMIDYLGMTIPEFKVYLENNFENWMSWNNIGLYNGKFNYGWDIDHIKPLSLFDLTKEEEIKKAWHYSNLQPLCGKTNREVKRNIYPFKKNH